MVRAGKENDLPAVLGLVKELAEYENALEQVSNTVERMKADGFGENPIFGFFVAENEEQIVGISIYYSNAEIRLSGYK